MSLPVQPAIANRYAVDGDDRHYRVGRRGDEGLTGGERFGKAERLLLERKPARPDGVDHGGARDPGQNALVGLPVTTPSAPVTIHALLDALGDEAVGVDEPGLARAFCRAASLARHAGSSMTVLMSQRRQRMSGVETTSMPRTACASIRARGSSGRCTGVGVTPGGGNRSRAAPCPARLADSSAARRKLLDRLAHDVRQRRAAHRARDAQFGERPLQPGQVARLLDEGALLTSHTS